MLSASISTLFFPGNHLSHSVLPIPGLSHLRPENLQQPFFTRYLYSPSFLKSSVFNFLLCYGGQNRAGWVFWFWITSFGWSCLQCGVEVRLAAPACFLVGLSSPSPGSITSNKNTDVYRRTNNSLWAQFSLNSYLEEKHSLKGKSLRRCSSAYHTNKPLTASQTTVGPFGAKDSESPPWHISAWF